MVKLSSRKFVMKTVLLAAALVLAAGSAHAQAWNVVSSQNGQTLEFDAASVQQEGAMITFTARTTFSQATTYTASDGEPLDGIVTAEESYSVDCANRTYTDRGLRYADASGQVIARNRGVSAALPIGSQTESLVGGLIGTLCPG